ncbi:MAG: ABC transporter ATP-binding protein/permease [Gemmatimonadetes bacterium]|nr:ABC transporter ATP-binding protein/permease [Gemmatimonadota bacterium]
MHLLKRLYPYIRPYRWGYAAGLLMVVAANAFAIMAPRLVGQAIDALETDGVTQAVILRYAGLILLVALLGGAARFGMRELLNGYSRKVETDLRQDFFRHLMRLDAAFYGSWRTGDLMSRATNDILSVRMAVGPAIMYTVNTLVLGVLALAFMLSVSPFLTLLALIPMVALPPVTMFFGTLIHRKYEGIQEHLGTLSTMVQENLAGARIVRAYVQEDAQEREFDDLNEEYLRRNVDLVVSTGAFHPVLSMMAGLGTVVVLWVGGRLVIDGAISVGDFVAFGFYLTMMIWPMIALGWVVNLYQRGAASMSRIVKVFDTQPAIRDADRPRPLDRVRGEIEFRGVRFRYPGTERDVLRDVSFTAPAGATVALVGPTGSGKSTIVALVARLHDPVEGEVLLDSVPLREVPLAQIRGAIGLVPQDAFLFSETLAENIGLGLEHEDAEADVMAPVRAAAAIAQLDEAIAGFPHGFETRLGERGINLSGGQRQRTTLARALARDPRILILDDSLSAVDTQTERRILHGLRDVLKGRTSLIVSHRVTAVMDADLILVLDEGQIVERGTHEALIRAGGVYAALLRRQLLEEGLEDEESEPDALAATRA